MYLASKRRGSEAGRVTVRDGGQNLRDNAWTRPCRGPYNGPRRLRAASISPSDSAAGSRGVATGQAGRGVSERLFCPRMPPAGPSTRTVAI